MEDTTDKINCPHCDYPIPDDEVICPVCGKIIANASSEVDTKQGTSEEVGKASTSSPYLYMYTTNPKIIMLLTGMFCLGMWLIFLFNAIEYNINEYSRHHRYSVSIRQCYFFIITVISLFLSSNSPFQKRTYLPQRLLGGKRVASLVFYSSYLLILVLIWHFYASNFISNDLNNYYYNKFYSEDFYTEVSENSTSDLDFENMDDFFDSRSTLADKSAKEKTSTYVNNLFLFYKITYLLGVVLMYLPFILYYAFNLDFLHSDSEPYSKFFEVVFGVPAILIFLFWLYLIASSFLAFAVTLVLSGIALITGRNRKLRRAYFIILTIVILAVIVYTQR